MISSRNNPLIKAARRLRNAGEARRAGLFLVEGIHLVGAAIEAEWPIESILYSGDLLKSEYGRGLVARIEGRATEISAAALESVCEKDNPQGILAIAQRGHQTLRGMGPPVYAAALASPQDPGNVGTILRTLDAIGASALFLLDGGVDPFHPVAVRAAMGITFKIPVVETSFDKFDAWRRGHGAELIGSSAQGGTDYRRITPTPPWILLLGNEQKGLAASHKQACAAVANLPMRGSSSSLNLAVAAGILLFQYAPPAPR